MHRLPSSPDCCPVVDVAAPASFLPLALFLLLLASLSCQGADGTGADGTGSDGAGDDDSAVPDDDDSGDDGPDGAGDDDTTPDPEDPFPGDSIHMGSYTGTSHFAGIGPEEGIDLCFGTMDTVLDAAGDFVGAGSCQWIEGSQGDGDPTEVTFEVSGRITDVGNMHEATLVQTYSWAPSESNNYVLDGSVSQGRLEFVWWGWMPMPDGEREFTADGNGDIVP